MSELTNCLSTWFPILQGTGVSVPRTDIIHSDCQLISMLDGEEPLGVFELENKIAQAAERFGYPCFLRSGQTSAKHSWKDSCFLQKSEDILKHVCQIVEYGELASLFGLPYDVWVVREMLPVEPIGLAFHDMPITKERRYFIGEGKVLCHHPYWPKEALEDYLVDLSPLEEMNYESSDEVKELTELSEKVSRSFPGEWSMDWLHTKNGWVAIDMAIAADSYHWPSCDRCPERAEA